VIYRPGYFQFSEYFKYFAVAIMVSGILMPISATAENSTSDTDTFQPLLEKFDKGYINWNSGEYIAQVTTPVPGEHRGRVVNDAMGKELALRVSRTLADSVFLQIVADTRVDAKKRLSQMVKDNAEIKLAGNIRGKKLIESKWVTRGSKLWLDASYRISMRGVDGVIANIYDQVIHTKPATASAPAASEKASGTHQSTVYIDARGTGLQPALFPAVMDQQHSILFDLADAGKSFISQNGAVQYVIAKCNEPISLSLDSDKAFFVTGSSHSDSVLGWLIRTSAADDPSPVRKRKKRETMKASSAEGLLKSNIIVGNADAERLRQAQAQGALEAHPHIIVITDGTIGGTEGKYVPADTLWGFLSRI